MKSQNPTIDILMATYNGSLYLRQQLYSLLTQTYSNWRLLVHDDGSVDGTLELLRSFANMDNRIQIIEDGVVLRSASENFMHLLTYSQSDFCICCDQDDIWLEDKLQVLYDAIKDRNQRIPQAVYANGYMYACDEGRIGGRSVLKAPERLEDVFFLNGGIQGCAILFNRTMRNLCIDRPDYVVMHDHLFTLVALAFGEFTYVDRFLMLYRRHAATVTDAAAGDFIQKTEAFVRKRRTPLLEVTHYKALKSFYIHYRERLTPQVRTSFETLFSMEQASVWNRIQCIITSGFRLYNRSSLLLLKLLLRPYLGEKVY